MAPDWLLSSHSSGGMEGGAYLGENETGVGVFDDGGHTVAVDGEEDWCLEFRCRVDLCGVGDLEFFEEDGNFPRIGAGWGLLIR